MIARPACRVLLGGLLLAGAAFMPAQADPLADFYHTHTLDLIVGYSAGGGYDSYARVVARHMGKFIPGNPTIVVQNMPGAGSLKSANYLFSIAPKDGTTFGTFGRGLAMEPLIGTSATQFDARKFTWLGSGTNEFSVFVLRADAPVKTWADMLKTPFTVGGEGSGSDPDVYAAVLKNGFGVKLKLISGYPGTAEIALALERGEVDGRASWSWSSLKALKPEWLAKKQVNLPLQMNLTRNPELPDVPLVGDFANNDRERQILNMVISRQVMGRPFVAPPGIPPDRARALRAAFDATLADKDFLAEAATRGLDVNPVSGAAVDKLIGKLYATPPDVIAETKQMIAKGGQ
jgi:tripartite-type tricarboxylate transporter receptor subunit TctC